MRQEHAPAELEPRKCAEMPSSRLIHGINDRNARRTILSSLDIPSNPGLQKSTCKLASMTDEREKK
jgi:hypothetical protein